MKYFDQVTDFSHFAKFDGSNPSLEFVRHVWVDYSGILRQRVLTMSFCRQLYGEGERYGLAPTLMNYNISDTGLNLKYPKQIIAHVVPDWTSLRICHFSKNHAWVMCFAHCPEEKDPFFRCPRYILSKVLERLAGELPNANILFGVETEFVLLDLTLQPLKTDDPILAWNSVSGLRDNKLEMMEEIVRTLHKSSIGVRHFHVEGTQQLELSTYPFPPMEAVDNLYYTQECLRVIARRFGYRATVAVKPLSSTYNNTSTAGLHFSLNETNEDCEKHFLAGILRRLAIIAPFSMPTYDSYHRSTVDRNGTWISWGTENRDVAIRGIKPGHWELRLCDATANFHILGALLISAGLDGIQDETPLTHKDLRFYSTETSSEELIAHGITTRLASNFRDALEAVRSSAHVEEVLGKEMKTLWIQIKELDEEALSRMNEEDRRLRYVRAF